MKMTKILQPTKAYLDIVQKESKTLTEALKDQLLILDLNGTLVSRNKKNKSMYVRPYSKEFFDYIFENFTVMLWSSAQTHSVKYMSRAFGSHAEKITVTWDRHHFGLSKIDFNRKVVTIKNLDKVWKYFGGKYDATNTVLLDDSPEKTVMQPYNAIHPAEFVHHNNEFILSGEAELLNVVDYLQKLQFQSNIANYIKQFPYKSNLKHEKNTTVVEYFQFTNEYSAPTIIDLDITATLKEIKL
ncbi:NLI interacting factor-like phosphatase-domain-containing protein [Thamnidium elegans]|uniref:Mitochondrial import inner membrane translocase subunit TIM50 n=1 Tax=Thamnidium elegans TaxID=101142 RepID=A0A8H7VPZ1_9FUNG|nr:hypothetical protein INT48_007248 [Thamnidium elegans]KAI8064114.1 NLI interacting factor-like phosphatase-domain-containing protein [Thamnidium elegans]